MAERSASNLLVNPAFEEGTNQPSGWAWVHTRGGCSWAFDTEVHFAGTRSVRFTQDGKGGLAEFRQTVPCKGAQRYRLQGRIRCAIDGNGSQSGANLYLRSLAGERQLHDMWFRAFFIGREEWRLWYADYVTPADAETLLVSFDMRGSCGVAWFDALELFEVPGPLCESRALIDGRGELPDALPHAASVTLVCDEQPDWFVENVLVPLLGDGNTRVVSPPASWQTLRDLSARETVIATPRALAKALAGEGVRCETVESVLCEPCARIVASDPLTRGFTPGDVIPWSVPPGTDGKFAQSQVRADAATLARLGFKTVALSAADGHPVLVRRAGEAGGQLVVMDVAALDMRPDFAAHANLATLVLTNALGRPQTSFGAFVYPGEPLFDYERFVEELHAVASRHPDLELIEEGQSAGGLPVFSLNIGPKDTPTFYVDCAIHSDEWAPSYGAVMYAEDLAAGFERGLPWAKALLGRLRFKCIPILSPDGWNIHRRYVRDLDLNRNFPLNWETWTGGYKGSGPLSEPEARIVDRIFRTESVVCAVNWHETTANAHWVGYARADGRYRKYAVTVPAIFEQLIDRRDFAWQAATWTQITDPRNFHYHRTASFPWVRDYAAQKCPYELYHADTLGIDGLTIEQYGNADLSPSTSPRRTDVTGHIIEMLFGLQVGLVCRNHGVRPVTLSVPLIVGDSRGEVVVSDACGREISRAPLTVRGDTAQVSVGLAPRASAVVALDPPPFATR